MQAPRLASFGLWAFTAFCLLGITLKYEPVSTQKLPAFPPRQEVAFNADHLQALFAPATPATPSSAPSVSTGSLQLKGIAYASGPGQSRALLQTSAGKVEPFAEGSRLPNGARLVRIDRRAIVYDMNGQQHQVALPNRPQ